MDYTDPNNYQGSDIEKINAAVRDACKTNGIVRLFKRKPDAESDREYWLIDSAILLPGNISFYIMNCKIKLSDRSRDNWFRSANCVMGEPDVRELEAIHITGEGNAVLEGADHPRATGDSGKVIGVRTYGTDAGKADQPQKSDWRNIGILLVKVKGFSITNISFADSHAWAVSLEYCQKGLIRDLSFSSRQKVLIDGREELILNRDGVDLRRGCRDITIENITGHTGDDLIALTALGAPVRASGLPETFEFYGGSPEPGSADTFNISIRNVRGYCAGGYHIIRLLNNGGVKLHHIQISNVMDTSPPGVQDIAVIKIGDQQYGGSSPLGDTSDIQITAVHSKAKNAILLGGSLKDSMISDVMVCNSVNEGVALQNETVRTEGLFLNNIRKAGENGVEIKAVSDTFTK